MLQRNPTSYPDPASCAALTAAALLGSVQVGYFWMGTYEYEKSTRLLVGLAFMIATMFIEVILLMIYVHKSENMPEVKSKLQ